MSEDRERAYKRRVWIGAAIVTVLVWTAIIFIVWRIFA